jgi:hypothetical protein
VNDLKEVASNDDVPPPGEYEVVPYCPLGESWVRFPTTNGTTYHIAVDGKSSQGDLNLAVEYTPDTSIDAGPEDGSVITDPTPTFDYSSNHSFAGFLCLMDQTQVSCPGVFVPPAEPSEVTLPNLADGSHVFQVAAYGTGGLTDPTPATRSFSVDTAAPDTTITKGPKRRIVADRPRVRVRFAFVASEAGAIFRCSLDGKPFVDCSSPLTTKVRTSSGKGKRHVFKVLGVDPLGHTEDTPATRAFRAVRAS